MKILFILLAFLCILNGQVKLSSNTYKSLTKIQKLSQEKKYSIALTKIDKLLSNKLNKIDKAYLMQSAGFIYVQKREYKKAISYFEQMNKLEVMNQENYLNTIYNIAQLNMSLENYKQTIKYLKLWVKLSKIKKAQAHIMLAQSYTATNQPKLAINDINKAISIKTANNKSIPLNWYEILFSNYYELKDYGNSIKTLHTIINIKPKNKNYWIYLSQIYTMQNKVKKGLSIYEQAYNLNILNDKDRIRFINFLFQNKLYFKGTKFLEKNIKENFVKKNEENFELLFAGYFKAKEYQQSLEVLNTLIKLTNKSKYQLKKARIHNMLHQNKKAKIYYELALKDKKLENISAVKKELRYLIN